MPTSPIAIDPSPRLSIERTNAGETSASGGAVEVGVVRTGWWHRTTGSGRPRPAHLPPFGRLAPYPRSASLKPAAAASDSEQNQRSPLVVRTLTRS